MTESNLGLTSIGNFREIGGFPAGGDRRVRRGVLYRSGHLAAVTREDLDRLESLGIRTIIDFRNRRDLDDEGDGRVPAGVRRVRLPMGDPARGLGDVRALFSDSDPGRLRDELARGRAVEMMRVAAEALVVERTAEYGEMVRELLRPGALPALLHCSAGKDRTGWAASLLLLALGVGREQVIEHYVRSNVHRAAENRLALERVREGWDPEWIRPFLEVRPAYAEASLRAVEEEFGGFDAYLRDGLGLSGEDLDTLRERLTEPA